MESIDLEMNDIFEEVDEEDVGALGALPDLPESTQDAEQDEDADQADVDKRLKALSKGAAKKIVRKPQPKLDSDRLTGERGIPILPKLGEKLKFKGKNHEAEDLSQLMRQMEHWAHRLFPKMPFDEVIDRVEKLGSKGPVKTCIRKMRLDMPVLDDEFVGSDKEDDIERNEDETAREQRTEEDMWDEMIEEQAQIRVWEDRDAEAKERQRHELTMETDELDTTHRTPTHDRPAPSHTPSQKQTSTGTFTPDQLERMERNKQLALERKLKKTGIMSPALKKSQPDSSHVYTATPLREEAPLEPSQQSSQNTDSENQLSEVITQGTSQNVVLGKKQEDAQKWCTQSDNSGDMLDNTVTDDVSNNVGESQEDKSLSGMTSDKSAVLDGDGIELNNGNTSDVIGVKSSDHASHNGITAAITDGEQNKDTLIDSEEMSEVIPNQNSENIVLKPVSSDNSDNTIREAVKKYSRKGETSPSKMKENIEDKENTVNIDHVDISGKDNMNRGNDDEFDDEITEDQLMASLDQ